MLNTFTGSNKKGYGDPVRRPVWWPENVPWTEKGVHTLGVNNHKRLIHSAHTYYEIGIDVGEIKDDSTNFEGSDTSVTAEGVGPIDSQSSGTEEGNGTPDICGMGYQESGNASVIQEDHMEFDWIFENDSNNSKSSSDASVNDNHLDLACLFEEDSDDSNSPADVCLNEEQDTVASFSQIDIQQQHVSSQNFEHSTDLQGISKSCTRLRRQKRSRETYNEPIQNLRRSTRNRN